MAEVPRKFDGLLGDVGDPFVPLVPENFDVTPFPLNGRFGTAGRRSLTLPSGAFLATGLVVKGLLEIAGRKAACAAEGRLADETRGFALSRDKTGLKGFLRAFAAEISAVLTRFFK